MRTLRTSLRATTATVAGGLALALVAAPAVPAAGAADEYTEDARAWKVVRAPSLPGVPGALVVHDGRFVAISGRYGAYTSNDGRRWKESKGSEARFADGNVLGAVDRDDAVLAWGNQGPEGARRIVFWQSKDGRKRWTRTTGSASAFGAPGADVTVQDVAPLGSGWLAVGSDATSGTLQGAVWKSKDGKTWSRVPVTGEVFGGGTTRRFLHGVANGKGGYVAVGSERRIENDAVVEEPLAWTSKNGTKWELVTGVDAIATPEGTPPSTRVAATSVLWDGRQYVALSDAEEGNIGGSFVSTSKDGRRWKQADVEHLNPVSALHLSRLVRPDQLAVINRIVTVPDGVVGVGYSFDREASGAITNTGAFWASGRPGRHWSTVSGGPFTESGTNTLISRLAVSGGRAVAIGTRTPMGSSAGGTTVVWQAKA